jgi:hypothetical protein
MNRSSRYS